MSASDLIIPILLSVLTCAIAWWRKDNVAKDLGIATARAIVQLCFLAWALTYIFKFPSMLLVLSVSVLMTVSASLQSRSRIKSRYKGILLDNLVSVASAIWPLAMLGAVLMGKEDWWKPEIFFPISGMLLGNAVNGISIGMNEFTHEVKSKREEVQSLLALGASVKEATHDHFRRCLRLALTPTINAMSSMGIVMIPGMMTGQILGGQRPIQAAIIQMLMMILVTIGTYFGALIGMRKARKKIFLSPEWRGPEIDFSPARGLTVIHGPNGCGKSLLLKNMGGLIPVPLSEDHRMNHLYLGSSTHQHDLTAEEFLRWPLKLKTYQGHVLPDRAFALLKDFGLEKKELKSMSMGQRQILNLIRALHLKSKILLLDEPTANLDPESTRKAEKLIQEWLHESNGSVVMVTHDHDQAKRLGVKEINFTELLGPLPRPRHRESAHPGP